ncbi:DNA alkylation repair protein [Brachyspira hyodysenteriae]|uniref:DNA alkylation repair protein n=1 Tax=Brachyspira hyodysenteriae ATCC 27164 TaxID=1266923 RepID=A0A3B6VSB9_BRAHO|nr:DNA alkylation repair protein [Brachyspira hyodysenteriae]ANN63778.1 DNA alkylation repair protein [Brachyspira hyodysenteriae ATCC 27164]KLI19102.1 DNA alkylation repair protein [Brachyspira hyodysenteriae]KLI26393.1 DNA alkylation repair protein [Brachyspira hyodysenteriae]KLI53500.1 DNA alkylation repair protein [Brachyspira hyodysenteriae]MCZ9886637.1 DNA alkylation repair protein [Brachyspira hyodysenteriae]
MSDLYTTLSEEFEKLKDEKEAILMAKYMKNNFEFLGIHSKERKEAEKKVFKNIPKEEKEFIDFNFTDKCYDNKYREFQYASLDYLRLKKKYLNKTHIEKLKVYALTKSWWDSIDCLDRIIGDIALRDEAVNNILLEWSLSDNIWLRRIAIDHQLLRKDKTNTELLEKIIINNFNNKEFFINKAIGWSLRDYSKTNPDWVRDFLNRHKENMANLSIKEASKYI